MMTAESTIRPQIWQFGSNVFGGYWDRPLALATEFGQQEYPVTYVGLMPSIRNLVDAHRNALSGWFGSPQLEDMGGIRVWSTAPSIPMKGPGVRLLKTLNVRRGRKSLGRIFQRTDWSGKKVFVIHNPVVWPMVRPFLGRADLVCYDVMDDWHALWGQPRSTVFNLDETNRQIVESCRLIFQVSSALQSEWSTMTRSPCILVRNGVDVRRFAEVPGLPLDLEGFRRPLLGYVGTLASWVDIELLIYLARQMSDGTLVLVGRIEVDIGDLVRLPNVVALGPRPYPQVPSYMHAMDVCLNPVRQDRAATAADPLKVYEYLATGRPVVSTDQLEVRRLGEVVSIATTHEEFVECVGNALMTDSSILRLRRRAVAEENSWRSRAHQIAAAIEHALAD